MSKGSGGTRGSSPRSEAAIINEGAAKMNLDQAQSRYDSAKIDYQNEEKSAATYLEQQRQMTRDAAAFYADLRKRGEMDARDERTAKTAMEGFEKAEVRAREQYDARMKAAQDKLDTERARLREAELAYEKARKK